MTVISMTLLPIQMPLISQSILLRSLEVFLVHCTSAILLLTLIFSKKRYFKHSPPLFSKKERQWSMLIDQIYTINCGWSQLIPILYVAFVQLFLSKQWLLSKSTTCPYIYELIKCLIDRKKKKAKNDRFFCQWQIFCRLLFLPTIIFTDD